jgi:hypothetical protein
MVQVVAGVVVSAALHCLTCGSSQFSSQR